MNSINEIKNQVIKCTKCELCKTRKNAVPGKGNPESDILFIGEAPGRSEDSSGEPFVGAAGKKLETALEKAGSSRKSVYITNVVKCRPPNNRIPSDTEKNSCQNYLNEEIRIIQPRVICIMGNTAYHSLLDGNNITKERGKFVKKNGLLYFLTLHPAAVIYNNKLLDTFENDVKTLVNSIK